MGLRREQEGAGRYGGNTTYLRTYERKRVLTERILRHKRLLETITWMQRKEKIIP